MLHGHLRLEVDLFVLDLFIPVALARDLALLDGIKFVLGRWSVMHQPRRSLVLVVRRCLIAHHLVFQDGAGVRRCCPLVGFRRKNYFASDPRLRRLNSGLELVAVIVRRRSHHQPLLVLLAAAALRTAVLLPFLVIVLDVLHRLVVIFVITGSMGTIT